ncbi:hypothetical protein [Gordonia cholesterolivorans]|uniref:Uncharacterized protein n=1 Tax=Gordonia cholesterolivorans TaxID=559625 RepID=A0ABN3I3N4_9ACTN
MSVVAILAVLALTVFIVLLIGARHAFVQIEADRRAEMARMRQAQRQAEARINRMAASAIHQMIDAAHRNHINPPPQ